MDVTEQEQLTEELQRREAYLAEAQRLSHTGSFGWKPDTGEIIWSAETHRIFEYDRAVRPTIDLVAQRVHPEDRAVFQSAIERAFEGASDFQHTYRLLLPDGRVRHVHALAHALQDASGNREFVGAVTDITERKTAEEALRASEAYLAEAQRLSHTGSWAWSPDTDVRYWSEECYRVLGFDPRDGLPEMEELIQRMHPDDRPAFRESVERARHIKLDEAVYYRIVHPGGAVRDVHSIGHPVFSPCGDLIEYTGTVIDITDRKRAEEERINERTRIARELHDTLLQSFHASLLGFTTASALLPERPFEARQILDRTLDQAAKAINEGREAIQGLRSPPVGTNDLALAVKALGEELAAEESNQNSTILQVEVEGTPRNLHSNLGDEIYRIIAEAMRNAFKHAQARRIEVRIRHDERELRVRVRDDGTGIEPKFLSEGGRPGHFGLLGMRERAKLLGGNLAVWSEFDSGTEVELSIPASIAYKPAVSG